MAERVALRHEAPQMSAPVSGIDLSPGASGSRAGAARAGWFRVGFAVVAMGLAQSLFAPVAHARSVFALYLVSSLVLQWMIRGDHFRSVIRSVAGGALDILVLSYAVYLLGPATTPLPFVYLLIPVMNAASSTARSQVAMPLALAGSLAYALLILITADGLVAHAPALATPLPPFMQSVAAGVVVVVSVLTTTSLVLRQMLALDRANQRLHDLSTQDELTALANRRQLMRELTRQLARVRRGARCALVMIDLDGFKRVNDAFGHHAGDRLLQELATALAAETRDVDLVARLGGDEFVVLLPDVDADDALIVAERIIQAIARVARRTYPDCRVSASGGLAFARASDEPADALKRADAEAYAAKRAGGNRVRVSEQRPESGVVSSVSAEQLRRREG